MSITKMTVTQKGGVSVDFNPYLSKKGRSRIDQMDFIVRETERLYQFYLSSKLVFETLILYPDNDIMETYKEFFGEKVEVKITNYGKQKRTYNYLGCVVTVEDYIK